MAIVNVTRRQCSNACIIYTARITSSMFTVCITSKWPTMPRNGVSTIIKLIDLFDPHGMKNLNGEV